MKRFSILFLLLALIGMLTACRSVSLDVDASAVTSVTVYYGNEGLKKDVTDPADIEKLLAEINSLKVVGASGETVLGGQDFVCVFHHSNGAQAVCTLLNSYGVFRFAHDGTSVETIGFDALALWEELDYEPQRAVAEEEVAEIPSA